MALGCGLGNIIAVVLWVTRLNSPSFSSKELVEVTLWLEMVVEYCIKKLDVVAELLCIEMGF